METPMCFQTREQYLSVLRCIITWLIENKHLVFIFSSHCIDSVFIKLLSKYNWESNSSLKCISRAILALQIFFLYMFGHCFMQLSYNFKFWIAYCWGVAPSFLSVVSQLYQVQGDMRGSISCCATLTLLHGEVWLRSVERNKDNKKTNEWITEGENTVHEDVHVWCELTCLGACVSCGCCTPKQAGWNPRPQGPETTTDGIGSWCRESVISLETTDISFLSSYMAGPPSSGRKALSPPSTLHRQSSCHQRDRPR